MIIALGLSLGISTVIGALLLRQVWPREVAPCPLPLLVALGVGLGMGVSAVLLFLWLVGFGPSRGLPVMEAGVLALAAIREVRKRNTHIATPAPDGGQSRT